MSKIQPEISFVIYYPFQFYFYKDIYKALAPRAEFVIDLCHAFDPGVQQDLLQSIVSLITTIGAPYRIIAPLDYELPGYLESFFKNTQCLVSTWEKGCMTHGATGHIKKVRVAYGLGKELTMVRPSGILYDLTLAHGPRDAAHFSLLSPTEIVGLPKFDDWFNDTVSVLPKHVSATVDASKPTILYLPTHGDLCSIELILSDLTALTKSYNVIAKVHYATARVERSRRQALIDSPCLVLDDAVDILPLFSLCDVVLSDNSSAIFEAMLADRPVVVADLWTDEYLIGPHQHVRRQNGGAQAALSYPGSLEQVIKRDGSVVTFTQSSQMSSAIMTALRDTDHLKRRRRELSDLFSFRDGACGERAAVAIRSLLDDSLPRERSILYYSLLSERRLGMQPSRAGTLHVENIQALRSVALLHIDDNTVSIEQRQRSLLSVLTQVVPNGFMLSATVHTLNREEVMEWINDWRSRSSLCIQIEVVDGTKSTGVSTIQQLANSDTTFSGLTHTSIRYESGWLTAVLRALQEFPQGGAVSAGGRGVSIVAYTEYHSIPRGVLYSTVFRTKLILGISLGSYEPAAFEAGLKKHLLTHHEWMVIRGLVEREATRDSNWYMVGRSDALVGESLWRGIWKCVHDSNSWYPCFTYVCGYMKKATSGGVHNAQ